MAGMATRRKFLGGAGAFVGALLLPKIPDLDILEDAPPTLEQAGEAANGIGVRWWLFVSDPDGFVFARGGRVATTRQARREIAWAQEGPLKHEREAWRMRRTRELMPGYRLGLRFSHALESDGSL